MKIGVMNNPLKSIFYDNTITLEIFCNNPQMQVAYLDLGRNMVRRLWNSSSNCHSH